MTERGALWPGGGGGEIDPTVDGKIAAHDADTDAHPALRDSIEEIIATAGYVHDQAVASTTWIVQHDLDADAVAIVVVDTSGRRVLTEEVKINPNRTELRHGSPFSGKAYVKRA